MRTAALGIISGLCCANLCCRAGPPELARDLQSEVLYHFMPIAWRDGDADPARFGDFQGMSASLPYLESLGVTAIWMNPIFISPAYHGYQHGPADTVNPRFGNEADFLAFVDAAHQRGIKVLIDFVVYGVSHDSVWFQDAFGNPSSPFDSYLAFFDQQNTQFTGATFPTWNGDTVGFIHWDLRNATVFDLVAGWAEHWLDPNGDGDPSDGVDGFRFDHVWINYCCGPNGWGYNLDSFWTPFFQRMKAVDPNMIGFAEQNDWGLHGDEYMPPFDATMTKPLEFSARSALLSGSASPLYDQMAVTLGELRKTGGVGTFLAIIGDHDVDRLASAIGADSTSTMGRARAAAAVLMFQPFAPIIYYGDEIGMIGTKQDYGSDANDIPMREPFKWNAVNSGLPMSNYHSLNAPAFNNAFSADNDGRSVEEQSGVPGSLLEFYRAFIALRRGNIALERGTYAPVLTDRSDVWAFLRHHEVGGSRVQAVLVVISLNQRAIQPALDLSAFDLPPQGSGALDLLSGLERGPITSSNAGSFPVSLDPFGAAVLEVDLDPPVVDPSAVDGRDVNDAPLLLLGRSLQASPTSAGDNVNELNQLSVRLESGGLLLGLSGNLDTSATALVLLVDSVPGGQNVIDTSNLSAPPSGISELTGMRLEGGFSADYLLFANAFGGTLFVDVVDLLDSGGGLKSFRGSNPVGSGVGFLTGGFNPSGMQMAFDNSNLLGVTSTDASQPESASSGFEIVLPWSEIGLNSASGQTVQIAAFISRPDGTVTNQMLPSVMTSNDLGASPDLTQIPGDQRLTLTIPTDCPGDANFDNAVDNDDIISILGNWLGLGPDGDANRDGIVDFADVLETLANWLSPCAAP